MAIQTLSTDLRGNFIGVVSTTVGANPGDDTTVILGEFIAGTTTEVSPTNRTTITVKGGKSITASSYDSATGETTLTFSDSTTFVTGDLRATSPTFAANVPVTQISSGNPGTASVDNTDPLNPILNLGLVSGLQGASGTAKSSPFIVNQPNDYVELDIDNVGTTSSIEQSIMDFSVSKFASGTGFTDTEGKRLRFISPNSSNSDTGLLTGVGELGFSNYQINNTGTVADAVADIIAEIQHGYVVKAADGRVTGLTWQFSTSLKEGTTDVIEFRDPDSDLTLTVTLTSNFSPAWTSTNTTETETSQYTNGGVIYSTGDFAHRTIDSVQTFFICKLGFTTADSNGTDNFPGVDGTHWDQYSPAASVATAATYEVVPTPAVFSVLDIVFSGTWSATANHGILIKGLPNTLTDDTARTELDLRFDASNVGTFRGTGGSATQSRIFTTPTRGDTAANFIADVATIMNAPRTAGIVTFPGVEGDRPEDDYFNFTSSVVDTNTLRLISDVAGAWDSVTIVIDGTGDGMTLQTGYVSNALTEGNVASTNPKSGVTYKKGTIIYYPTAGDSSEGYMQLATGDITTTSSVAELPGTLATWKQIT